MSWNDLLCVHIRAIDEDHKQMLRMINDLYDGIMAGKGRENLDILFGGLVDYTQTHFRREEALFENTDYPHSATHKQEHVEMIAWVTDTRGRFQRGLLPGPSLELMNYLKDWLFHHIATIDKGIAPYLDRASSAGAARAEAPQGERRECLPPLAAAVLRR